MQPAKVKILPVFFRIFLCLLAPLALALLVLTSRTIPPGSATWLDPDWYYLGASLTTAMGHLSTFIDHPGVPLAYLGGALLRIRWHLSPFGEDNLVNDLLLHSEQYHQFLGTVVILLNAATLFCFGLFLARRIPILLAVAVQFLPLVYPDVILYSGRLLPEGVTLSLSLLLGMIWLRGLQSEKLPVATALAVGLSSAVKLTFFPFALLALQGRRLLPALAVAAGIAAAFVLFVLPVAPEKSRIIFHYFLRFALNDGNYGGGNPGLPGLQKMQENFLMLYYETPESLIWFLVQISISLVLLALWFRRGGSFSRNAQASMGIAVAIQLVGAAASLKHPNSRYFLPYLTFFPAILAAHLTLEKKPLFRYAPLCVCFFTLYFTWPNTLAHYHRIVEFRQETSVMEAKARAEIAARPECLALIPQTSNDVVAMMSGIIHGANGRFSEEASRLFPRHWAYSPGQMYFHQFREVIYLPAFRKEMSKYPCVLFQTRTEFPENWREGIFPEIRWTKLFAFGTHDLLWAKLPKSDGRHAVK